MKRPEIIYLQESIIIEGVEIGHTKEGLQYLIDHYTKVLSVHVNENVRSKETSTHMESLIENWKRQLHLYDMLN